MAIRYGMDRNQVVVFPDRLEDYIGPDDPVRVYDAFVDALDFAALGIEEDPQRTGNPQYDPRAMVKLLLYGYSYGIFSSRKLERAVHHNVSFMWLVGGLTPDHKTISEFRRNNRAGLQQALAQCARVCLKLELVEGNILFVDSTKIWANAGKGQQHKKSWYEERLKNVEARIEGILRECDAADQQEAGKRSLVKMSKDLARQRNFKDTIQRALAEIKERGERTKEGKDRWVNRVDPESTRMKGPQGTRPSFLVQAVVDDKNGLITSVDAVNEANDLHQMADQIMKAEDNLGKQCQTACADAGYYDMNELAKLDAERSVIVPSPKQVTGKAPEAFAKERFVYDREQDCYYCPAGKRLKFLRFKDKSETTREYRMESAVLCRECEHFGECTSAKKGRNIERHVHEDAKKRLAAEYVRQESREIYARRKARAEHPFGYMKKAIGFRQFNLRGRVGARVEASLLALGYNLKRMIALSGGVEKAVGIMAGI